MRVLQMVILALIAAYPDDVLCARKTMREAKKADKGPCGQKYLRKINDKCYYIGVKKMSWFGAQNNCLRKNLQLADLATPEDFEAIIKFLKSRGSLNDYWWGGNDLQAEGRFTYISNGRPVRYLGGQDKIEPTERSNEDDCLEVRLRENSSLVIDDNCEEKQYFVCQKIDMKCAHPMEDTKPSDRHSHEHLHHFHHNPAANEGAGVGEGSQESAESDSRPADSSNSTEIGVSPEDQEEEENPNEENGGEENAEEPAGEEEAGEEEAGEEEAGEEEAGGEDAGEEEAGEEEEGGEDGGEVERRTEKTPADDKKKAEEKAIPPKTEEGKKVPADNDANTVVTPVVGGEAAPPAESETKTEANAEAGETNTPE